MTDLPDRHPQLDLLERIGNLLLGETELLHRLTPRLQRDFFMPGEVSTLRWPGYVSVGQVQINGSAELIRRSE